MYSYKDVKRAHEDVALKGYCYTEIYTGVPDGPKKLDDSPTTSRHPGRKSMSLRHTIELNIDGFES